MTMLLERRHPRMVLRAAGLPTDNLQMRVRERQRVRVLGTTLPD